MDFFQNEPTRLGGWRQALRYYLVESSKPLLTGLIGGFAHPWLLLADAIELGSETLAMDTLALIAVDYSGLSKMLEMPFPAADASDAPFAPAPVLEVIRNDKRVDGVLQTIGIQEIRTILTNDGARSAVATYLLQVNLKAGRDALLRQFVDLAVHLLTCAHVPGGEPAFDFFLNHVLSFCNCVRILLPVIPDEQTPMLFRMLWLMTILPYVTQQRPVLTPSLLEDVPVTMSWEDMQTTILRGEEERTKDPHFVKMIQLLSAFPSFWPEMEPRFLRAANKAMREFEGWRGFGAPNEALLNT